MWNRPSSRPRRRAILHAWCFSQRSDWRFEVCSRKLHTAVERAAKLRNSPPNKSAAREIKRVRFRHFETDGFKWERVCVCVSERNRPHTLHLLMCARRVARPCVMTIIGQVASSYGDGWLVRWLHGCAHAEERNKRQRGPYLQRQWQLFSSIELAFKILKGLIKKALCEI